MAVQGRLTRLLIRELDPCAARPVDMQAGQEWWIGTAETGAMTSGWC